LEQLLLAMSIASMLSLNVLLAAAFIRRYWEPNLIALAFIMALGAQLIGRWLFYKRLEEREL
jgi:DMSO reductase anchor subunit